MSIYMAFHMMISTGCMVVLMLQMQLLAFYPLTSNAFKMYEHSLRDHCDIVTMLLCFNFSYTSSSHGLPFISIQYENQLTT